MSFTGEGKFVTLPQKGWVRPYSELYRGGEICYVTPRRVGTLLIVSFTGEGKFVTLPQKGWDRLLIVSFTGEGKFVTLPQKGWVRLLIVSFTGEGKFVTLPQKGWDTPHSELYRGGEICYVTPEGLGQTL